MTKNPFNNFMDILFYLPRKTVFRSKEDFIKAFENEAAKYKFEKLFPKENLRKNISKFLKDLSNNLSVTNGGVFIIEQLDAFKLLASASVLKDPSSVQKLKKEFAKRIMACTIGYTDSSERKPEKKSKQILEVAKRYKGVDDQVFTYLLEYAECWREEESGTHG